MSLTKAIILSLLVTLGLIAAHPSAQASSPLAVDTTNITHYTQQAHNIESWWEKEVVRANVAIDFGGNRIVDGSFTFEAHGPRARFDRADGVSIIFDGETAWVTPAEAEASKGRFHVLTWPWFIMAPFKMQGDGINLSEASVRPLNGDPHLTLLQTFGDDMGDTADDWYRFFINRETNLIDGMSYIVTYGKGTEAANKQPSIIRYFDYTEGDGPRVSTRYELWYWDPETGSTLGEAPKGTGTVTDISYLASDAADFTVPEGAHELKLPPQPIDYSDYVRLLDNYVTRTGVRYEAWFENTSDLKALDDFMAQMAEVDLSRYSEDEVVAFYINLYNAGMLQAVFDAYPIQSVKNIGLIPFSVFKKDFIEQNGRTLSLDGIEKGILFEEHFDPRIHFAVNCASESCPPLLDVPFTAKNLEAQLEAQTRAFAKSARAARVITGKKRIQYSELFNWYDDHFEGENPAEYLNKYREMPLPLNLNMDWIKYDWSLNVAQ